MVGIVVKYMDLVLNGLKHAKTPAWYIYFIEYPRMYLYYHCVSLLVM